MIKFRITFILFFVTNILFAQNTKIFVFDKETNLPIALASIYTQRGIGSYSNEDGSLYINITKNDTLYVKHLSYNDIKISYDDFKNLTNNIIYLVPKEIELQQVVVKPTKLKKISLGYYKEKTFSERAGPGGFSDFQLYVNHIKNQTGQVGVLDKLHFDLHVELTEKSNSRVRIRVFSVGKNGLPNEDILTKEIIKKVDRLSPNIHVDVSEFNILFPPEGVFIGLEFFCTFETKLAKRENHTKDITNCPHIATSNVSNFDEMGNSFYWSLYNRHFQWICCSDGSIYKGLKGHVFKFGADILNN